MKFIKCIVIGDTGVGKTCLLIGHLRESLPTEHIPTIFDNYSELVQVDGRQIRLDLWDTTGQEAYDHLGPIQYPNSDVCLICFSTIDPSSFKNVEKKWAPEFKSCYDSKDCCIILVGTKIDLRSDEQIIDSLKMTNEKPITYSEGCMMADRIGARKYVECSAITREGLNAVFDDAVCEVMSRKRNL